MKKMKIAAYGNKNRYNFLIVEKQKDFFPWFQILVDSFDPMLGNVTHEEKVKKSGDVSIKEKKLESYKDKHESYETKHTRLDAFYGAKRVFIAIHTPPNLRKKFIPFLEASCEWVKNKKK